MTTNECPGCGRDADPDGTCPACDAPLTASEAADVAAYEAMCEAADRQAAIHMVGEDAYPWSKDEGFGDDEIPY